MSKISTYEVAPVPKLADKLIGTSVGGEIEDVTYNFTLQELLEVFLPVIPANNLQGVLDYGNTATQDINLFGTITTTNLDVTDTANLFITYLNEETHIVGSVFDSEDSAGTSGQVLTSTGDGVEWVTLPPIFTPNLQQVLEVGNTADIDIILDANIQALDISSNTANIGTQLTIQGTVVDYNESGGTAGQVLASTSTNVEWVSLPVYSATSPLSFNPATGVFSIQQATSSQNGYLSSSDWITFDGKQNAGNYITALTGEATASGPGSASVTLSNAAVIGKVLTGFNPTAGTINPSDSILTAFGKTQSQINALVGGVQYKGTWNASTNVPTLVSSVGVQGNYYIVSVAGNTNLNGITDWQVGDWAIFSESTWQKVDNTDSVTSVNGFTGAVSLTTDNIPEGTTNLYYLDSRARAALSFAAGSGAYNNTTGVITIPTNNNQILNGANYITLSSLSVSSPLVYNNLTGEFSIPKSTSLVDGYLSAADWSTFNGKQNYLGGTGLVKSTAGTISYITDNSGNWNTAYDRSIVSAAVTGTTTKTLTLNEQDGGTITASWTDLDTGLTSVGVSMPSAFSVANSPLTSNGTIAVTGAGTTLQYIDGTGALQNFPGLTGFVPYTGANQNVNLGEFGISAGYFQADLTPTGALQVGRMQWNATDGTMDLRLLGNNVTLQIGQENVTRVVNKSGIDLLEANYQVVRVRKVAEGGAQGQRLAVVLAQGNNENNSTEVIGLVTETINSNQEGFVTAFGEVKNINTTGSLQGETWVDGDILYISTSVAGQLTNIRPVAPNHAVTVGYVTYAHANHGKIYMAIDTGYELGELHNVYAPSPTANQSIYWDTTNSRYQLNTIGGILGYTPANDALVVHLAGTETITGAKTFSTAIKADAGIRLKDGVATGGIGYVGIGSNSGDGLTIGIYNSGTVYYQDLFFPTTNGYQYTFPNATGTIALVGGAGVGTVTSVAALTLGTSGTDLSSTVANSTTTPVITLNVPTASAANRGALSAADWSTFNTKVGSVTASSPLASSGGQTPNLTIQQSSGSQAGFLSAADWTTFNNKQAAGNYITSLTGEATATGPGAASVTLNNAAVTGKVLTGVNITGGSISATDSILTAFGKVQNQINGLIGSTIYQGTWNASTNTPALASGVGVRGYYYIVSVAGTTNLDGITDWFVGDWAIFDGTAWQQVDNTDAVVSVNGFTGAVSLTTDNISEGATNQYFLNSRARAALSFTSGSGAYNSTTGVITIPTNTNQLTNGASFITLASLSGTAPIQYNNTTGAISITQSGTASNGFLSSTDWNTFNNKLSTATAAATYVPYTGATSAVNLGVYKLTAASIEITGGTGTTGNLTFGQSDAFSIPNANNSSIDAVTTSFSFAVTAADSTYKYFKLETTALTNNTLRSYTLPDASGTLALTSQIPANPVGGTGTTNYLPKFTGASTIGNSQIFDNGTNVGIGTASPNASYRATISGAASGVIGGLAIVDTDGASYSIYSATNNLVVRDVTNSATRLTLDASGNFGIGSSPIARLTVVGTGSYNVLNETLASDAVIWSSEMTNDQYNSILQLVSVRQSLTTGSASNGFLGFSTVDDSNAQGIRDAGRIAIVNESPSARNSATALSFWTNAGGTNTTAATEKVRITSGGNVGIGIINPVYPISVHKVGSNVFSTVYNVGQFTDGASTFKGINLGYDSTSQTGVIYAETGAAASNIAFWNYNGSSWGERMRLTSGGDLLIGDTTASANLWVKSSASGNTFGARNTNATFAATVGFFGADRNTTNNSFYYIDCYNYGSSSYRFRVADNGNVTSAGSGLFSSNLQTNGVLTIGSQFVSGNYCLNITPSTTTPVALQGILSGTGAAAIVLQASGGNIGIGIASPTFAGGGGLHINQAGTDTRLHLTNSTTGSAATDGFELALVGNDVYYDSKESAGTHIFYTAGSERMRITSGGVVGIGTSSLGTWANLQVAGNFAISGGGMYFSSSFSGGATPAYFEYGYGTGKMDIVSYGPSANGYITFGTGGSTERMRITSGGNVGIGTTSPLGPLEVRAANRLVSNDGILQVNTTNSQAADLGGCLSFGGMYENGGTTPTEWAQIAGRKENSTPGVYSGYLQFATRPSGGVNTERMRITSTGVTQLKQASGQVALEIFNSTTSTGALAVDSDNFIIGGQTAKGLVLCTNNLGQEKMRITVDGNYQLTNTVFGTSTDVTTTTYRQLYPSTYNIAQLAVRTDGQFYTGAFSFRTADAFNANLLVERMRIQSDGTVRINAGGATTSATLQFYADPTPSNGASIAVSYLGSGSYGPLTFGTGGSERMRITSGGNIGIGTSGPATFVEINKSFSAGSTQRDFLRLTASQPGAWFSQMGLQFRWNDFGNGAAWNLASVDGQVDGWSGSNGGGALVFYTKTLGPYATDPTEKMRINAAGALCLGTTTPYGTNLLNVNGSIYSTGQMAAVVADNVDLFTFVSTSASYTKSCFVGSIAAAGSTSSYYFYGQQSTSVVALKIFTNGNIQNTNNSYGAISDARLKENIIDATPKLEDLMKVKVRNYNLKGESTKQIGVISQELEEIFPNMIEESTNIGENVKIKGVKYSVFVPMLIKAVQELKAEIETLKNK